ncbi:MAG: hypothetical protein JSU74_03870 [Candidatus Zixiibacteriota bacterium]|nr:MAG: hypothetical protein JSU74_03870 [candidate division Zixibacteria bacterium]
MPGSGISSRHAFFLGIMALLVAVMCVTIRVIEENLEARIIMAVIWVLVAVVWLVQAARSHPRGDQTDKSRTVERQSE